MKTRFFVFLILSSIILSSFKCKDPYKTKNVFILNKQNIDNFIISNPSCLILFYNNSLESEEANHELISGAEILGRIKPSPVLASYKIESKEEHQKFKIQRAPAFVMYIEEKDHYFGNIDEPKILQIFQKVEKAIIPVKNQDEINLLIKECGPYIINLMYVGHETDEEFNKFLEFKNSLKEIRYSICYSEICEKKYQKGLQSFVLFKNYLPNKELIYDRSFRENEFSKERITEWLDKNTFGHVMKFSERFLEIGLGKKGLALVVFRSDSSKNVKEYNKYLTNISKKGNYPDFAFYATDIDSSDDAIKAAQYFLVNDKNLLPYISIFDNRDGDLKSYPYNKDKFDINEENLTNFLQAFLDGNVDRKVLSEDPEKAKTAQLEYSNKVASGDSRVKALVKSNFEKEVIDNEYDVMVLFYADWCEHCHEIMPLYESLAQYMSINENLKFGKIDMAKNTLDGFKVSEFPTFKIFPANDKHKTEEYQGHAILEEFALFIKKFSHSEIIIPEIIKKLTEDL